MKQWIVLIMSFFLASCGERFVYQNIDWFIVDYIEEYTDLTSSQEKELRQRLEVVTHWHQEQELPKYIQHIDELLALDVHRISAQTVNEQEAKVRLHTERLINKLAPDIYALTTQLSDTQVEMFMSNLSDKHQEYWEQYADLQESELREVYQERITKQLDKWLGDVNVEQQAIVKQWASDVLVTTHDWADYQSQVRYQIGKLLEQRSNVSYFQTHFSDLLFSPEQWYSESFKRKREYNRQIAVRNIVEIAHKMDERQVHHLHGELEHWKSIFTSLKEARAQ